MISSAKDDGSRKTIHSDHPASRGGLVPIGDLAQRPAIHLPRNESRPAPRLLAALIAGLAALLLAAPAQAQQSMNSCNYAREYIVEWRSHEQPYDSFLPRFRIVNLAGGMFTIRGLTPGANPTQDAAPLSGQTVTNNTGGGGGDGGGGPGPERRERRRAGDPGRQRQQPSGRRTATISLEST